MKAHKDYREVDIPGLYKIPKTWIDGKFKYNVYYQEGPGLRHWQFMDKGVKVICVTNITENGIDFSSYTKYISKEEYESSYKHFTVKRGNLLIASSGASWGKIAEYDSNEIVILNTSTIRLETSKRILNSFLKYLLESQYIQDQLSILITGSCQPNFGPTHLSKLDICLPSDVEEQSQIAAYLDYKTNQIDRFIANRKKQIELLEEQKEAIIKKAVTKGIDSTVRQKESNIEYVGRIPEHWAVAKLKYVAKVKGRIGYRGYTTADLVDEGNGALTLGATQFDKYGRVDLDKKVFISWDKYYESPEIMIDKGDLIVVQRGSTSGKVGIIDQDISPATINPSIVLIKKLRINRYFLFYYLRAISDEFSYLNVSQTAIPMLSQNQIENIPLLVVPKDEQEQILLYIETELKERDEIITKFQQQIDLMQEYKTSLISKAVTGKIDVREWQPKQILKETV